MPIIEAMDARNNGGRLAARLIEDWYQGTLQHHTQSENESRAQSCFRLRGTRPAPDGVGDDHDLIQVPSQTHGSVISCLCRYCRYHFVFEWWSPSTATVPAHHQHHFVIVGGSDESFGQETGERVLGQERWNKRTHPLLRLTRYQCTVCGFNVKLEVSAPRLDSRWIDIVTDVSRARRNLKRAMAEDPARFSGLSADKIAKLVAGGLITLNMYITNIMSNDGNPPTSSGEKKISERNKTFMVQFGPECEELFFYLGFKKRHEAEDVYYISPREPPQDGGKTTDRQSERAFFENVKSEIQSVIHQPMPQLVTTPIPVRPGLEKALGCADIPKVPSREKHDPHYFYLLGASPSSSEESLKWAYERQVAVDPDYRRYYVEALQNLAAYRDTELQLFAIQAEEATPLEKSVYDKDWEWFGLSREQGRTWDNDRIVQRYKEYRDTSPTQRHFHRLHLAKIGRDLDRTALVDLAAIDMDVVEANDVLGIGPFTSLDYVANAAMASVNNNEKDLAVVVAAMNVVGDHHDHHEDPAAFMEFERISGQLTTLLNGESHDPYLSGASDNDQGFETKTEDLTLPAGLVNLRNTCYLNSILQYLYTVDVIRDLLQTLNLDTLEASTEKMGEMLRGAEEVQRKEAWLGHEFARELKTLFHEMEESTSSHVKPRQRLANTALARAGKVSPTTETKATEPKAADSKATDSKAADSAVPELKITRFTDAEPKPALPPRHGEETSAVEHVETASVSSSQTLVGEAAGGVTVATGTEKKKETEKAGSVEALAKELDQDEVKGTDQQDVDEAMGNILEHLQAAVKLARARRSAGEEDETEEIPDPVDNHFYSDFVMHSQTSTAGNEWSQRDDRNRLVMAPLHETKGVKEDMYQVIGRGLDIQRNEETKLMTYTAIKKPADILHFLFPRSRQDGKNENPVELNDPLYLDLFMDVEDKEDERYKKKTRLWAINRRSEELRAEKNKVVPETNSRDMLSEEELERFLSEDSPTDADGDYELVDVNEGTAKELGGVTVTPEKLKEFDDWTRVDQAREEDGLEKERKELLASGDVEYRLHAVFCHRGSTGFGHYWVWIKDFERGVWRKYNDNIVTIHSEEEFRRDAGCAPEPCWAAYVRAGKTGLVSIPLRKGVGKEVVEAKVKEALAQKGGDTLMWDA
ncbi:hypothetical protein QBC41DRAFT_241300 [Cercophora samala]|uniref:ubiquitinyl hydrolase 1 n=1 Tax=Cercophora samala TaxID=330535 RepID=A0AA39ZM99_9PEZI|nr:hypothetical protein QBC41DRAFT_241300 [Cercophora samala]